ncbi:MAG TPA: hypothetical protein VG675_22220 [Bryobacteraceae bacterium]|nr:hypothetical protein [Bryobacteraceae bacterium]
MKGCFLLHASLFFLISLSLLLPIRRGNAAPITVRHLEGRTRGFLVLRDSNDKVLASGGLTQLVNGSRVTSVLSFHFKDGSTYEETTVFSQRRTFRLLSDHVVQKGPSFKRPTDMSVNGATGEVVVHYTEDGKPKTITDHLKLPADVANGLLQTLLCDVDPKTPQTTLSMVVSTPKPRIVKLEISPLGEAPFSVAGASEEATRYEVKIHIGGIAGAVAPLVGKQPPNTYMWIARGKIPGFLKSEGPMFEDGPIWKIELASPVWPKNAEEKKQ